VVLNRSVVLGAALLLAVLLLVRPGPAVVATVNGEPIYREELDRYVRRVGARGETQHKAIARRILQELIDRTLILQEVRRRNLLPHPEEVDARLRELRAGFASDAEFDAALRLQGLSAAELRDRVRFDLAFRRLLQNFKVPEPTDAELRAEYARDPSRFDTPPRVRIRHILVRSEAEARIVLARLRAGESFAELSRALSQDPKTREEGGELGWARPGELVPEIERVAFSLPVGATSPPVRSRFGYHVVQVVARMPGRKATLESARAQVRNVLMARRQQEALARWLQDARRRAKITLRASNRTK
jgi:foldase protein PrsA